MKDEKYTPEVGSWLKGREVPAPDSQQTTRQIANRLPQVRQRSRWWPVPIFRRATRPSSTDEVSDYLSTPIAAEDGHTPTVTGRTRSMFSPVKAISAGALVFAVGGVLLIAQPFDQPSRVVPGAATDDAAMAPAFFTVHFGGEGGMYGDDEYHTELGSSVASDSDGDAPPAFTVNVPGVVADATDSRVSGVMRWARSSMCNGYFGCPDADVSVMSVRIENADGAWEGTGMGVTPRVNQRSIEVWRLTGEDGYDGLSVVMVWGQDIATEALVGEELDLDPVPEVWGWITPTDAIPAVPDLPAVE